MYKKVILIASVVALFTSCDEKKQEKTAVLATVDKTATSLTLTQQKEEGYLLMKNNCYVCHNPNAASHDDIIAPPFKAVKMRYSKTYTSKKEFVDAVVDWVQNPSEDKALMRGAVQNFNLMPKLPLETSDLEKIATYIYENDVEQPTWMPAHMKEKHPNGMGKGMKHQ